MEIRVMMVENFMIVMLRLMYPTKLIFRLQPNKGAPGTLVLVLPLTNSTCTLNHSPYYVVVVKGL